MTKDQKNEVIGLLKDKFSQYSNFYITDTESLTVSQVGTLRRTCFDKKVEMKVAKNTLIRKALESFEGDKYSELYESLHKVTALMFSENPKDPALIISSFRKSNNGTRPVLKAAFINGDVYTGDEQLKALTQIKTKDELVGEVLGLLQSPARRVIAAMLHYHEQLEQGIEVKPASAEPVAVETPAPEAKAEEVTAAEAPVAEVAATEVAATEVPVAEAPVTEVPVAEAPAADATEEPTA